MLDGSETSVMKDIYVYGHATFIAGGELNYENNYQQLKENPAPICSVHLAPSAYFLFFS